MTYHKPRTPVVSSKNHSITCALPLLTVCIAGLLFVGCATKNAAVTIHIFGGRSMQEGEHNKMEAPSDVHDLIGDLDVSGGETSSLKSSDRGGGGGKSTAPATGVAPPGNTNAPPPSTSADRAVNAEGDQTFLAQETPSWTLVLSMEQIALQTPTNAFTICKFLARALR